MTTQDAILYFFNRPQEKDFIVKLHIGDFEKVDEFFYNLFHPAGLSNSGRILTHS